MANVFPPATAATAVLLDASGALVAETLPAAAGSGAIYQYILVDKTNAVTISPAGGEAINGVTDLAFDVASNYEVGTQFIATDRAPGTWDLAVIGAPTSRAVREFYFEGAIDQIDTTNVNQDFELLQIGSAVSVLANNPDWYFDTASERDLEGFRAGDVVTLPAGVWRVEFIVEHGNLEIPGGASNGQGDLGAFRAVIRKDSTDLLWGAESEGTVNASHGYFDRELTLSADTAFEFGMSADADLGAGDNEDFGVVIRITEVLPRQEVVLAGMVTPEALEYITVAVDGGDAAAVSDGTYFRVPFNAVRSFAGSLAFADGKVTLKAGNRYKLSSFIGTSNEAEIAFWDFTNDVALSDSYNNDDARNTRGSHIAIAEPIADIDVGIATRTAETILGNSALATLDDNSSNSYMVVEQLPVSTVVDPGSVPVENLRTVVYSKTAGLAFGPTYSLDSSATWQDLINTYEFLEFNYEIDVTGVTEDVLRTIIIKTADIRDDTRWRFEYGDGVVDIQPGVLTGGDWAFVGATVDTIALEIVGVKSQKTVINENVIEVDDQAASGYFDVGTMRMQWGTISGDSGTFVFPVAFAATPTVQVSTNSFTDVYIAASSVTSTQFNYNTLNFNGSIVTTGNIAWFAIGLKP